MCLINGIFTRVLLASRPGFLYLLDTRYANKQQGSRDHPNKSFRESSLERTARTISIIIEQSLDSTQRAQKVECGKVYYRGIRDFI